MPRHVDPAIYARATELYASGRSFQQVAAELGMDSESLRVALRRRGVVARPPGGRPAHNRMDCPDIETLIQRYTTGESEKAIADNLGVSRNVITRWLRQADVTRRGPREAAIVHTATLTPEQRSAKAAPSHAARRGQTNSDEFLAKVALGKERAQYGGRTSPGTEWLCAALTAAGIDHVREKAVGRYNLDIALTADPIAIEVLGGGWHASKPIHAVRTPYLLHQGWHVICVWNFKRHPIGAGTLNYIEGFNELLRINPPPVSQYRVIGGDGHLITSRNANDDDFPLTYTERTQP